MIKGKITSTPPTVPSSSSQHPLSSKSQETKFFIILQPIKLTKHLDLIMMFADFKTNLNTELCMSGIVTV
jgi:hypothetical protein